MAKKTRLVIVVIAALLILAAAIISTKHNVFHHIATALEDVRKENTTTEIFDLIYSDNEGNTIVYYVCVTTYYESVSHDQIGLNTLAISALIDPGEAESSRECTVSDLPAAIYEKDGRAYLCWTIMPELSCVIEYDPATESEADMFRMAESVPANAGCTVSP